MRAKYRPDQLTPLTPQQAREAIRIAFIHLEGHAPTPDCLSLLMGQSALECWRWRSIHGNCFGNEKASDTWEGFYQCYKCNEKLADGRYHHYIPEGELVGGFGTPLKGPPLPVPEGHPQTRFKAFETPEEGALRWLELLKRRYPEAYNTAKQGGTAKLFAHCLKLRGYFTADEKPYADGVGSLAREYLPLCQAPDRDTMPVPPDPEEDDRMICEGLRCVAPDPTRWLDAELRVMAQRALELSDPLEAARDERREQMKES